MKLFDKTVIIVNPGENNQTIKQIADSTKYNVSEDLVLQLKKVFSGVKCNILFGTSINDISTIGMLGDESFKNITAYQNFYNYLLPYSNLESIISEIIADIDKYKMGIINSTPKNITIEFNEGNLSLDGKVTQYSIDLLNSIISKYHYLIAFEIVPKINKVVIDIYPKLKHLYGILEQKQTNNLSYKDKIQLVEDKLAKAYGISDYEVISDSDKKEIYIDFHDGDVEWYESSEYIADFQQQYGYEPSQDCMYYDYDYDDMNKLQLTIENILKPEFNDFQWEIENEYKTITLIIKL